MRKIGCSSSLDWLLVPAIHLEFRQLAWTSVKQLISQSIHQHHKVSLHTKFTMRHFAVLCFDYLLQTLVFSLMVSSILTTVLSLCLILVAATLMVHLSLCSASLQAQTAVVPVRHQMQTLPSESGIFQMDHFCQLVVQHSQEDRCLML